MTGFIGIFLCGIVLLMILIFLLMIESKNIGGSDAVSYFL